MKFPFFIAEIGNNHFGDFDKAKELIRLSKLSGATLAKLQAIDPDFAPRGSMPDGFYKACAFTVDQYLELISYGQSIGIPVFYSIFGEDYKMARIKLTQKFHKISASQSGAISQMAEPSWGSIDKAYTFVSINQTYLSDFNYMFSRSYLMYASDYLVDDPLLLKIDNLRKITDKAIGYSDHTIGVGWAIASIDLYGFQFLEKHFTDEKEKRWNGIVFRDTVHGATPEEFEKIVRFPVWGG